MIKSALCAELGEVLLLTFFPASPQPTFFPALIAPFFPSAPHTNLTTILFIMLPTEKVPLSRWSLTETKRVKLNQTLLHFTFFWWFWRFFIAHKPSELRGGGKSLSFDLLPRGPSLSPTYTHQPPPPPAPDQSCTGEGRGENAFSSPTFPGNRSSPSSSSFSAFSFRQRSPPAQRQQKKASSSPNFLRN